MSRSLRNSAASLAMALAVAACVGQGERLLASPEGTDAARLAKSAMVPSPASPGWQEQARTLAAANNMSPLAAARVYAALSVAQYAAVVAVDKAKSDDWPRTRGEGDVSRSLREMRRGAVAGASQKVLTFFLPAADDALEQRVRTERELGPGNSHPHFMRGYTIGRAVGTSIATRTAADRFTTPWTGTVPTGPGKWIANGPPAGATFGGVTPYVMTSGSQFRSPPPPVFDSPAFLTDLAEIKTIEVNRTVAQRDLALYWNFPTGTFTPPGFWNLTTANYITAYNLDEREATHAFALTNVAMMDALIGCWDAKYFYWVMRPSQADPSITLTFGLPNHPSYPSGHSCSSAAAATVLAHLFPNRAAEVANWVDEAGLSRMYAGIHYRFDITAGKNLGDAVAQLVIARDTSGGLLSAIH